MSRQRQCYNTAELVVVLIILSLFLQFPVSWLVSKRKKLCFSKATFKHCFQLTTLLFCWKKTPLEVQNLITIVLSWPTWLDGMKSKLPWLKNMAIPFILTFMHQSFETPAPPSPIVAWAGHSLFMQVKVSEVPGSRGQKWMVHSPTPTFQYMVQSVSYTHLTLPTKLEV